MAPSESTPTLVTDIITTETVNCLQFFQQQKQGPVLLCYGSERFVSISVLHFPRLEPDIEEFTFENLTDIQHGSSVQSVAWSPQTSMLVHPVGIIFVTAGLDNQLRLFRLNNKMEVTVKSLGEHSSFVNDIAFEPTRADQMASVGDDKKCRIWDTSRDGPSDALEQACIPLTSAGMSVKFNAQDPTKLLVAELSGTIRFYDLHSLQPIMSLSCPRSATGLLSCDWSQSNPLLVGGVSGKVWHIWDSSKSTLPEISGTSSSELATEFSWCPSNADIFLIRGRPNNETVVYNISKGKSELSLKSKLGRGLAWHNLLPVCAVGGDRTIAIHNMDLI